MSKQNLNTEKLSTTENEKFPVDCLVGLPPLQLNEIYNGDSFELCKRVPAKTVDLILEDMPYNTTACEWDIKIDLELYWKTRLRILKPTGAIVLTATQPFTTDLIMTNRDMFRYEWVWEKERGQNFIQAKKQPLRAHEMILVFYKKFGIYNPQMQDAPEKNIRKPQRHTKHKSEVYGLGKMPAIDYDETKRYPKTILKYSSGRARDKEHPTQKPVGLFEYLIRTYSNEGDLVFDGFGGSGTTAVACHKSKRNFIVIEKEQKYFDLATRRLDNERRQLSLL